MHDMDSFLCQNQIENHDQKKMEQREQHKKLQIDLMNSYMTYSMDDKKISKQGSFI